jgi:uncharacterized protein (TIGR03437 family)
MHGKGSFPRSSLALCILFVLATAVAQFGPNRFPKVRSAVSQAIQPRIAERYGSLPLAFEANTGQTDPEVKFLARGGGYTLFLTATEAVLSLSRPSAPQTTRGEGKPASTGTVLRMKLLGGNAAARVVGLDELPGKSNYFIGNDAKKWRTNIRNYARVRYHEVYPGIDVVYYGNQGRLEHDFVVAPGADPGTIRLAFEGSDRLELDARGDLAVHADGGQVRFHKPLIYQEVDGLRREVAGNYRFAGSDQIAFGIGPYDSSEPLVIDPVLSYSTYLGGSRADAAYGIAVDSLGNAYVTGKTSSTDFPTAGPLHLAKGLSNAFVAKLNANGSSLAYSTYLGGNDEDEGYSIAVDSFRNAYMTGLTRSRDFPVAGPFQSANRGGGDAFVAKLNANGSALVYSTYLGGGADDEGHGMAVDSSGSAYVTGWTDSADFPTARPLQPAKGGFWRNAFVAKLNPNGSALVYSTYLGGGRVDEGHGIAVDSSGTAYVTGRTSSTDFPTAPWSPLQSFKSAGADSNAFVAKLSANGSALVYSTYLGGGGSDQGYGIAVDSSGSAYVTGTASSTDFPIARPLQRDRAGDADAFVAKLNGNGSALVYSTYLGGSHNDQGLGVAVDSSGSANVTGLTFSPDFPIASPLQPANRGLRNAFVAKLNPNGSALVYSTYLGGSFGTEGNGIALDSSGNAYVTGLTSSTDFPTVGPLQPANGGGSDVFVVKVSGSAEPGCTAPYISAQPSNQTISAGQQATLSVTAAGTTPLTYQWYQGARGDTSKPVGTNSSTFTTPPLAATTSFWVRLSNACDSADSNTATVTVTSVACSLTCSASVPPVGTAGSPVSFTGASSASGCSGTVAYDWDFGDGTPHSSQQNPAHTYANPGVYTWAMTATIAGATSCRKSGSIKIEPSVKPRIELVGLEVTQALQDWTNSIPLIAGKRTFVRAHVQGKTERATGVSAQLRVGVIDSTGQVVYAPSGNRLELTPVVSIDVSADPYAYHNRDLVNASSLLFELSPELSKGRLELEVFDFSHSAECKEPAEAGGTANDCKVRIKFEESPAPVLVLVGLWTLGGRNPEFSDMAAAVRQIEAAFAIPEMKPGWDWFFLPSIPIPFQPRSDLEFNALLMPLVALRVLEGQSSWWIPRFGEHFLIGLLVDRPSVQITAGQAAFGFDVAVAYLDASHTVAHEFGHLTGRPDTPHPASETRNCLATPIRPGDEAHDPPEGTISDNYDPLSFVAIYGFEKDYYLKEGFAYSPATPDLMTYCDPKWPSPHTYKRSRDFLCARYGGTACGSSAKPANSALRTAPAARRSAAGQRASIISGRISFTEDTGKIESVYSVNSREVPTPSSTGSYVIRLRDKAGQELGRYGFEPTSFSGDPSAGLFFVVVPSHPNTAGIDLLRGAKMLDTRNVSANAPTVTVRYPNGGESLTGHSVQVSWTASDPDGDSLRYALQYSGDGGATWHSLVADWSSTTYELDLRRIPGSRQALIRVLATDGFHTSEDQSDATFTVGRKPPETLILGPDDNTAFFSGQSVVLRGAAYDSEDGALGDANLRWTSDLNGDLGVGRMLTIDASTLKEGTHKISLVARDSDGETGVSTIRLRVFRSIPVSGPRISAGGVVNGASFSQQALAAGSIASVFGANLASSAAGARELPLAKSLAGVTVLVGGIPAPLFYVSPGQINFQVPWELQGQTATSVVVSTDGIPSPAETISLALYSPGIFTLNPRGQGAIVIASTGEVAAASGSIPGLASRPARRGEYLSAYCTGLGPVTNPPASGRASASSPLSTTSATASMTIGGVPAAVSFSGLTPGFVGLYQVNVQVAPNATTGSAVPAMLTIGGANSNTVTIAIQ